jgi:uncharacterized protein GlcG (DUF336 family)
MEERKMPSTRIVVAFTLAAVASLVAAQDKRPGYGPSVTVTQAKKIAAGAVAECQKKGWTIAVAIVDPHGTLVYYEKMEDTQLASADIAIGKARTAATYRRSTRVFADAINKGNPSVATLPAVVASPGGVPLMVDGKVIGAVGASGMTGDQDEECSLAGAKSM